MSPLSNSDLDEHLARIEAKLDIVMGRVYELDKALAVHKAKTSWVSLVMGGVASVLVALGLKFL